MAETSLDQSLDRSESSDSDPLTQYSVEEIRQHCREDDCWVIFKNRVYDLSAFKHPAELGPIKQAAGGDATERILLTKKDQDKLDRIIIRLSEFEIGRVVSKPSSKEL
jgi:cytochrome b involved in lipid metabolism